MTPPRDPDPADRPRDARPKARTTGPATPSQASKDRLKAALRANLARRKAQARGRAGTDIDNAGSGDHD